MSLSRLETRSLTPLHWIAVALALVTGVVHLALGVLFFPGGLGVAFLLAGFGFLGGVVLFLLDYRRRQLYPTGVAFTAVQIVLYLLINPPSFPDVPPAEAIDKVAQILLVVALVVLYRREG
jgi:hypothetical protein